jgi:hypothetical protein
MMGVIMRHDQMDIIKVYEFGSQLEPVRFQNTQTVFQQKLACKIFDIASIFQWKRSELWIIGLGQVQIN